MSWFAAVMAASAAVLVLYAIVLYNRLVRLRNTGDAAWADIDVHLKKRRDLVPNLVETVKGYAGHERALLEKLTAARALAAQAAGPVEAGRAEGELARTLKSFFAVAESYPDLKANRNFLELQQQLQGIEDGIEAARRYYNAVVRDLNTAIEQFPANLLAARLGFGRREFFELEAPAEERKPVAVRF